MAVLSSLGLLLASCQSAPPPASPTSVEVRPKLVVGYVALNATQLPTWVAREQDIFARNDSR